ncbi:SMC5-SMC6 complex localization factor protein 2 isoform X2 [Rhinatrema bivittatum]|uniref:SMC5-SMC6 complex localization factor protein 2 isoform X2 n=1 Tax=Rhinatrema bivittatum TaxID=194408 RepID=UPI0011264A11|nr:SMC5-SMC6 complex localization factor protein 2 isoform X2 [Rhinatrema bivittatum]
MLMDFLVLLLLPRNQAITNYFRPTQKPDSILSGSPQQGSISHDLVALPASGVEQLAKSVKPSAAKFRRKRIPRLSPSRSPIMDAFLRNAKKEKLDSTESCVSNCNKCHGSLISPKVVVRKLPISSEPPFQICKQRSDDGSSAERGQLVSCDYSKKQKTNMSPFEGDKLDSSILPTDAVIDILKDNSRSSSNRNNTSQHPTSICSRKSLQTNSKFQTSEGTCRQERELIWSMEQSKQSSCSPLEAVSGANILNQENGSPFMPKSGLAQWEAISDGSLPSKQTLIFEDSSPKSVGSKLLHDKSTTKPKGGSCPPICLTSKTSLGSEGHKNQSFHGKRKRGRISRSLQSSRKSGTRSSDEAYLITSPDMLKDYKSKFGSQVQKPFSSGMLQQEKAIDDKATEKFYFSENQLDCLSKDEDSDSCSSCPSSLSLLSSNWKADPSSLASSKENLLQVSPSCLSTESGSKASPAASRGRTVINGFAHTLSKTCSEFPKDIKYMDPASHDQTATFSHAFSTKTSKPSPRKAEDSLQSSESCEQSYVGNTNGDSANLYVMAKSLPLVTRDKDVKLPFIEEKLSSDSCSFSPIPKQKRNNSLNKQLGTLSSTEEELSSDSHSFTLVPEQNKYFSKRLRRRLQDSFDSEGEGFDCNLDSDEEEILKPLQEIMCISRLPEGTPEKALEVASQHSCTSPKFPAASPVAYVNNLDCLLKEKREAERLDELEKKLQDDIKRGVRELSSAGEEESTDEEILSEEQRAFIKNFSVVTDAIPDLHPGQEIFHLSEAGKLFNRHTLYLKNFGFNAQTAEERLLLSSGKAQQLILITQGFLSLAYRLVQCPVPLLRWLFQMVSVQLDNIVSAQILKTLLDLTVSSFSSCESQFRPWIPSLSDIAAVFVNMGVNFKSLFPLQHLQPDFNKEDIIAEMRGTMATEAVVGAGPAFPCVPENNIINIVKFLGFCTTVLPEGYKDQENLLLILLLCKIRLEKQLKLMPLVEFQCLLENLLKNIQDWDAKMPELCLAISDLSTHHHDLLKLVQLVPNSVMRGRQVRKCLSCVIISKLLKKKCCSVLQESDMQMSYLCKCLVQMKPSTLLKKMAAERTADQQNDASAQTLQEVEQEAYYLTYSLLNLVNEVSYSDVCPYSQRNYLLELCRTLEKHVKCDIREDARLFYRTKVKDLVARIYGKWQELLQSTRPDQGKLHDYWEPVLDQQIQTGEKMELKEFELDPFSEKNQLEHEVS